jgi:hypothetical protein
MTDMIDYPLVDSKHYQYRSISLLLESISLDEVINRNISAQAPREQDLARTFTLGMPGRSNDERKQFTRKVY